MVFKKSLKIVLLLLSFLITIVVVAQTDSLQIQTDTVIVKAPPVVIKKTIYIPEHSTQNSNKWSLGFEYTLGNTLGGNRPTNPNKYATSMAIYVEKELHHIFFTLGIGLMSIYENRHYQTVVQANTHQNIIIPDTIDTYMQEKKPVYIIQNQTITKTYSIQKDTNIHQTLKLNYLQISSMVGYNFNLWKIKLSVFTGFKPGFLLSTNHNIASQINKATQPYWNNIPLGLKISYRVSESLNLSTNLHYLFNLQSIIDKSTKKNVLQHIGIGINYIF